MFLFTLFTEAFSPDILWSNLALCATYFGLPIEQAGGRDAFAVHPAVPAALPLRQVVVCRYTASPGTVPVPCLI